MSRFAFHNDSAYEPKTYLQVEIVPLIDRSTKEGNDIWMAMIDHHCFNGNDSMMVFERFWGENMNLDEIKEHEEEMGYETCIFEKFVTRLLHEWGYFYNPYSRQLTNHHTGDVYAGTLLDITW